MRGGGGGGGGVIHRGLEFVRKVAPLKTVPDHGTTKWNIIPFGLKPILLQYVIRLTVVLPSCD